VSPQRRFEPVPVSFSSEFDDDDPLVSPDGQWLYFEAGRQKFLHKS